MTDDELKRFQGEVKALIERTSSIKQQLDDVAAKARAVTGGPLSSTATLAQVITKVNALERVNAMLARIG